MFPLQDLSEVDKLKDNYTGNQSHMRLALNALKYQNKVKTSS